jgi:hypothetical protein
MTSIAELPAQVQAIGALQRTAELQGAAIERLELRISELSHEVSLLKASLERRA